MFAPENFGDLLVTVALEALEKGQRFRRQDAHLNELGTATLTSCFVNANRDPKKGKPAKPSDFFYFGGTEDSLSPAIANAFFSVTKDLLMPDWVVHISPIDLLKQYKTDGGAITGKRMLIGDGIAIFFPEISEQEIFSDFVVFNEAIWGWQSVRNVDTNTEYQIFVEPPEYEQQYCRDVTFDRR